jgi:hypothetical protein
MASYGLFQETANRHCDHAAIRRVIEGKPV